MTQEKLEFANVTFKIDHDGDLEIVVDSSVHDAYVWLKTEEIIKLKDFLIKVIQHG